MSDQLGPVGWIPGLDGLTSAKFGTDTETGSARPLPGSTSEPILGPIPENVIVEIFIIVAINV